MPVFVVMLVVCIGIVGCSFIQIEVGNTPTLDVGDGTKDAYVNKIRKIEDDKLELDLVE